MVDSGELRGNPLGAALSKKYCKNVLKSAVSVAKIRKILPGDSLILVTKPSDFTAFSQFLF